VKELLQQWNAAMADAVKRGRQALVLVRDGRAGAGAGTIWHPDGLILTNAHVVKRRHLEVVLPDGQVKAARIVAHDAAGDVAALSIEARGLPTIALGDSRQLRPGDWVTALGHPWGVLGAATAGTITGVGKRLPEMPRSDQDWIAISLHLRPGHSGGPLVDAEGRLIGINTMMAGPDVGLAVPVHTVKAFLRRAAGL
jgi:S1-C subfamily serine protease